MSRGTTVSDGETMTDSKLGKLSITPVALGRMAQGRELPQVEDLLQKPL